MSSANVFSSSVVGLTKTRIEGLANGIFAFAMPLLILMLSPPSLDTAELPGALQASWTKYLSYVATFVMLGVYWINHHNQFHFIKRSDRLFLWINLLFLMSVAFVPFTSGLLGTYGEQHIVVIIYGLHMALIWMMLYLNWWYATHDLHLVDHDLDPTIIKHITRRTLMGPALFIVAVGLSFFSLTAAVVIYLLVPIVYVVPGGFDKYWKVTQAKNG